MVIQAEQVTQELVDAVEGDVGYSQGGWDMVDPREIIAAAFNWAFEKMVTKPIEEHLDDVIASVFISDGGEEAEYIVLVDKHGDNIASKTMAECIKDGRQYLRNATEATP